MIKNLESTRSGRCVPNQFIIETSKGTFFQSYKSVIAKVDNNGCVTLSQNWNYSVTTLKYLYQFLRKFGYDDLNPSKINNLLKAKEFKYAQTIKM